ncbi:hypothetical protein ACTXGQ_22725 [Marinobacter sp. 1Y8]
MKSEAKDKPVGFLLCFVGTLILVLAFDPGTNASNLPQFSELKLGMLVFALIANLFVLALPLFWKPWSFAIGPRYILIVLAFTLLDTFYLFESVRILVA